MKYILAKYLRSPLDINDPGKTIGIIVQTKKVIKSKFSTNANSLKQYDSSTDLLTFNHFEDSLKSLFKEKMFVSSPKDEVNPTVAPTDTEFLQELRNSYQGKYQFSEVHEAVNYSDINQAIEELYNRFVNL